MTELDAARLSSEVTVPHGPYAALEVVASTGSTNADLREAAEGGAADRTVLIAEEQTAGIGRLARTWVSPAGAGLYVSVLYRTAGVPLERTGSLAMVAGLALTDVAGTAGVDARLKWPNDMLAGGAKLAGVLSELLPTADGDPVVVLGIGLNVNPLGDVPPGPGGLPATSLAEAGATTTDRTELAVALLRALAEREHRWRSAGGDLEAAGMLHEYRNQCESLGSRVEVSQPDGTSLTGVASDIDATGRLTVVADGGERTAVSAGDVTRLR